MTAIAFDEQQLRLIAAKVLDEGKNCHKWKIEPRSMDIRLDFKSQVLHGQCEKCGLKHSGDEYSEGWGRNDCPHLDLPKDKLEVLAFRCRDKSQIAQWSLQMAVIYVELYDRATVKLGPDAIFSRAVNCEINGDHLGWLTMYSTPAHWIIAAAKAKGIDI